MPVVILRKGQFARKCLLAINFPYDTDTLATSAQCPIEMLIVQWQPIGYLAISGGKRFFALFGSSYPLVI